VLLKEALKFVINRGPTTGIIEDEAIRKALTDLNNAIILSRERYSVFLFPEGLERSEASVNGRSISSSYERDSEMFLREALEYLMREEKKN